MYQWKTKYNDTLDDILVNKKEHLIVDINEGMYNPDFFTNKNKLTSAGRNNYWREIDQAIKDFDYGKEKFLPHPALKYDVANHQENKSGIPYPPVDQHQQHQQRHQPRCNAIPQEQSECSRGQRTSNYPLNIRNADVCNHQPHQHQHHTAYVDRMQEQPRRQQVQHRNDRYHYYGTENKAKRQLQF